MNTHLKELMLEAGFAAPEVAGRAQKLAELIVEKCAEIADAAEPYKANDLILEYFGVNHGN